MCSMTERGEIYTGEDRWKLSPKARAQPGYPSDLIYAFGFPHAEVQATFRTKFSDRLILVKTFSLQQDWT